MIDRILVETVIGKTFADRLDEPIFKSGNWTYTRREMVEKVGCANFIAAATLGKVLHRLSVHSPKELSALDPFSLARSKSIGETALFVAACILDANGYSVEKWWAWDRDKNNLVKFSTFKHHAQRRARKHKQEVA